MERARTGTRPSLFNPTFSFKNFKLPSSYNTELHLRIRRCFTEYQFPNAMKPQLELTHSLLLVGVHTEHRLELVRALQSLFSGQRAEAMLLGKEDEFERIAEDRGTKIRVVFVPYEMAPPPGYKFEDNVIFISMTDDVNYAENMQERFDLRMNV